MTLRPARESDLDTIIEKAAPDWPIDKIAPIDTIRYVTFHFYNEPTLDRFFDERIAVLEQHGLHLALFTHGYRTRYSYMNHWIAIRGWAGEAARAFDEPTWDPGAAGGGHRNRPPSARAGDLERRRVRPAAAVSGSRLIDSPVARCGGGPFAARRLCWRQQYEHAPARRPSPTRRWLR